MRIPGIVVLLLALLAAAPLRAAEEVRTVLAADTVTYDDELGLLIARGNVELAREGRVVLADSVTYNERDDIAAASGNVSVINKNGDVLFSDYMVLRNNFKEAVVEQLRIRWKDDTLLAAQRGAFISENQTVLHNVVASPCKLCKEDPTRAPIWQLRASKIKDDKIDQTVSYYDTWLEIYGVPVLYLPYISHPSPEIKKQSGFLMPSFGFDSDLGFSTRIPYFWNIAPNQDLTIAPMIATNERPGLYTEYRQHFGDGYLVIEGSGTYVTKRDPLGNSIPGDEMRGHIRGTGRFDINNNWRWGFDLDRATDRTYLRRYDFDSPTTLTSRGFVEGFSGRSYALADTYFFQGQRSTDRLGDTPIVAPFLQYHHVGEPTDYGATWRFDASMINIARTESADTMRLAFRGGVTRPFYTDNGQIITVDASVMAEGYWADILVDPTMPFGPSTEETEYRIYPQLVLDWRYPWVRRGESSQQVIEPIVALMIAPPDPNKPEIPNEDSIDFQFTDANLLASNRFPGIDLFDGGTRIVYGLKAGFYDNEGSGYGSLFVGQSYRVDGDTMFPIQSGLEDPLSDIVGRIEYRPAHFASLTTRFRFDKDNLAPRAIEIDGNFDFDPVHFDIDYTFIDDQPGPPARPTNEQVYARLGVDIDEFWTAYASHRHDLTSSNGPLRTRFGVRYEDECFALGLDYERSYFNDADIRSDNRFYLTLYFKHFGELRSGI